MSRIRTDGSTLARKAAKHALTLARSMGGKIVGFHVAPAHTFRV